MFSGIIYCRAKVLSAVSKNGLKVFDLTLEKEITAPQKGMSIAVNGVCLTATSFKGKKEFKADATAETLEKSSLKNLKTGDEVNIEFPVTPSTMLSGHIVQGHVDGVAKVEWARKQGDTLVLRFSAPPTVEPYLVKKGSIAIDGTSLTINHVDGSSIEVCLIPHTLAVTLLGELRAGDRVNMEADMIAKQVARLVERIRVP